MQVRLARLAIGLLGEIRGENFLAAVDLAIDLANSPGNGPAGLPHLWQGPLLWFELSIRLSAKIRWQDPGVFPWLPPPLGQGGWA